MEITTRMRKLTHVPVQTWKGWSPDSLFRGWFSSFGGFKTFIGGFSAILGGCLILPCLLPLLIRSVQLTIEAVVTRQTASQIMALTKYQSLPKEEYAPPYEEIEDSNAFY